VRAQGLLWTKKCARGSKCGPKSARARFLTCTFPRENSKFRRPPNTTKAHRGIWGGWGRNRPPPQTPRRAMVEVGENPAAAADATTGRTIAAVVHGRDQVEAGHQARLLGVASSAAGVRRVGHQHLDCNAGPTYWKLTISRVLPQFGGGGQSNETAPWSRGGVRGAGTGLGGPLSSSGPCRLIARSMISRSAATIVLRALGTLSPCWRQKDNIVSDSTSSSLARRYTRIPSFISFIVWTFPGRSSGQRRAGR